MAATSSVPVGDLAPDVAEAHSAVAHEDCAPEVASIDQVVAAPINDASIPAQPANVVIDATPSAVEPPVIGSPAMQSAAMTGAEDEFQAEVDFSQEPDVGELAEMLVRCSGDVFLAATTALKQRVKDKKCDTDVATLADALVSSLRIHFVHESGTEFCKPLVELLDEFCAAKAYVKALSMETVRGLLKEQLRNLHYCRWSQRVEGGQATMKTLNLSCVMLLSNISKSDAYSLLLELGADEEAVDEPLVAKCLRKLSKSVRGTETEAILNVVHIWLQKVHPRRTEASVVALKGCIAEMVEATMQVSRETTEAWIKQLATEEASFVDECRAKFGETAQGDKESQIADAALSANLKGARAASPIRKLPSPLKRRVSSPGKLQASASPCASMGNAA